MADGLGQPRKGQTNDIRPTPDYKELAKPLEPPPRGLEWRRLEDGTWELKETEDRKKEGLANRGEEKESPPEFLEHVVMPDDTLVGICLKYKVKDRELRRLNGFVGNNFRMCDALIIPNRFAAGQEGGATGRKPMPMTRDKKMQIFRGETHLGPHETRFYLEASGWELTKALDEWRAEVRWEAEQTSRTTNAINSSSAAGDSLSTIHPRGFEELAQSHLSVPGVSSACPPQGVKLKTQ